LNGWGRRLPVRRRLGCGVRSEWLTEGPSVSAFGDRIEGPTMGHETTAQSAAIPPASDRPASELSEETADRQCGRCREFFPAATAADAAEQPNWWVCPACRTKFFGTP
jgi:hypothetical protein